MPIILFGIIIVTILMGLMHVASRDKTLQRKHRRKIRHGNAKAGSKTRIMFIIAHPDDEVMFFSPTILNHVSDAKYEVFILCLTKGNHYGHGHVREKELFASCSYLGVKRQNIFIIDDSKLPDQPHTVWDKEVVSSVVQDEVDKYNVDVIFTFDNYGVSGHKNHQSIYLGVEHMMGKEDCPEDLMAFQLVSVSIFRKYISVLDTFYSYITSSLIFTSPWLQVFKAQQAMTAHWSQLAWFRILYVIFSRYMIINTYEPIDIPSDLE